MPRALIFSALALLLAACGARDSGDRQREVPAPISLPQLY